MRHIIIDYHYYDDCYLKFLFTNLTVQIYEFLDAELFEDAPKLGIRIDYEETLQELLLRLYEDEYEDDNKILEKFYIENKYRKTDYCSKAFEYWVNNPKNPLDRHFKDEYYVLNYASTQKFIKITPAMYSGLKYVNDKKSKKHMEIGQRFDAHIKTMPEPFHELTCVRRQRYYYCDGDFIRCEVLISGISDLLMGWYDVLEFKWSAKIVFNWSWIFQCLMYTKLYSKDVYLVICNSKKCKKVIYIPYDDVNLQFIDILVFQKFETYKQISKFFNKHKENFKIVYKGEKIKELKKTVSKFLKLNKFIE